jgi:nuclear transport factor 2 (NTF2) superfamily protein
MKVRLAEDAWNTRNPEKVALAYTLDSKWRNRAEFVNGRQDIIAFLKRKWARELDYRLIKDWFRSYGNENWEFNEGGLMRMRYASINDLLIKDSDRKYYWPLGRRPDGHAGLSELNL